jgi:hypothetical protein
MFKNILRLLAGCASFVALLFMTSPAIASTTVATAEHQLQSSAVNLAVNLNVASPSLQLAGNPDTLANHVGCSCAACTQVLR